MKLLAVFIFAILSTGSASVSAGELVLKASSFSEAEKSSTFFRFVGHSTKLGIIGTDFIGYARSGKLRWNKKDSKLTDVALEIDVSQLDTDSDSRNEKMRTTCLEVERFPVIRVLLSAPVDTSLSQQTVAATLEVHGHKVPISVVLKREDGNGISGESSFKLSDAQIPDPSIIVAAVRDEFKIQFRVGDWMEGEAR